MTPEAYLLIHLKKGIDKKSFAAELAKKDSITEITTIESGGYDIIAKVKADDKESLAYKLRWELMEMKDISFFDGGDWKPIVVDTKVK